MLINFVLDKGNKSKKQKTISNSSKKVEGESVADQTLKEFRK